VKSGRRSLLRFASDHVAVGALVLKGSSSLRVRVTLRYVDMLVHRGTRHTRPDPFG